ncbi:MAG: MBL fold metallo-hydrolase, partial [Thermoanaerobaculia bacterium]|nr:MBL fold metallo-hydrolase [Thermoanaerobaculia bacterium]
VFSPDGARIVFESDRDGTEGDEIYVMGSDGSGVRKVAEGVFPTWAPGGGEILFESDHALWAVGVDGESPPRRLAERAVYGAWAPDGSAIAAATFDYDDDCRDRHALTLLGPDGSERRRLLPADPDEPTVEWLGAGIFAVLQPESGRFDDSNSVVVERDGGLLVIDTQASLAATRRTIEAIRRRSDLPVRQLVLTHWHGDHVQGQAAYRELWPDVQVLGHVTLEADIRERAEPQLADEAALYEQAISEARERLERGVDREDQPLDAAGRQGLAEQIAAAEERLAGMTAVPRPLAVPDLGYGGELVLGSGPGAVRLLHRRAHTRGDTIVHLPEAGVLVTGDVLDDLPFGGHGYPSSWIATLDGLADLDFELVVPGHGRVRRGRAHLERVLAMLRSLVEQVDEAVERELEIEGTRAAVDLEPFRRELVGDDPVAARVWEPFIQPTIERAWLESRGELPADG